MYRFLFILLMSFTFTQEPCEGTCFSEEEVVNITNNIKELQFDLEKYKQKLQTIGKIVEYSEGRGWAEDINEDGSLKIKSIDGDYINLTSPLISEVN